MPECEGDGSDEVMAVRGPSGDLMEMCQTCLNDGWDAVVEVLD
jgi:hypothetical protein